MLSLTITSKVRALRAWMKSHDCQAFIIPTMDPHNSEYLPARWKMREWITGFTGSAGTAVVTEKDAALWTDTRYWLQAEEELKGSPFKLMRDGAAGVQTVREWIEDRLGEGDMLCYVAEMFTEELFQSLLGGLADDIDVDVAPSDPFDRINPQREPVPSTPIEYFSERFTGKTIQQALGVVRSVFKNVTEVEEDVMVLNDATEISWLLNLRASDVEYNPVALSFFAFSQRRAWLFVDEMRLGDEAKAKLKGAGVQILPYNAFYDANGFIKNVFAAGGEFYFADTMNLRFGVMLEDAGYAYHFTEPFIARARAIKLDAELRGIRQAHLDDAVAICRLLAWLDRQDQPETLTELDIVERLEDYRKECPSYHGPSFGTISAYGAHGAIVHYEPTPESNAPLTPGGLLLLDAGGHYDGGTTDMTRTIPIGTIPAELRRAYTLVLRAHIGLELAVFPEGTTGLELDYAARQPLWRAGMDYGHGTGHGIGTRLCAHEGPHQIRKDYRAATVERFLMNMLVTDEPGLYMEGRGGVRLENVLVTRPYETTEFGKFLSFVPLTLVPFDVRPLLLGELTDMERTWLNAYHQLVREKVLPLLTDEADRGWLIRATKVV